ncbi:MAG: WXG100 family type VII secretion target [Lachnospiraceae bacterium]|nr:WXG100 family type VII secretion target [Lachnospiraceae bacterium]
MAQILAADYVRMNDAMVRMGEIIRGLQNAVDTLYEHVERLDITWQGEANTQFMLAMLNDINRMRLLQERMVSCQRTLREILGAYQRTEGSVSERIMEM